MFGDLELHHATGQYLGRHASQLPSRLHQPQKPVDEEEEDATHSLGRMVLPHMPRIECKQEDIKLVDAQEYIEELLPNLLHGGGPHHQRHHSCNDTRHVRFTRVFPFTHLPQTQSNHQNNYSRLKYPLGLMTSAGLIIPQMWINNPDILKRLIQVGFFPPHTRVILGADHELWKPNDYQDQFPSLQGPTWSTNFESISEGAFRHVNQGGNACRLESQFEAY